ncbi:MAG: hypothetical protein KIT49_03155 [Nitrospira sp.]|nr:hypothetical protein [Nitrospira sp.]
MEAAFSWDVIGWTLGLLIPLGFGFAAMLDFRLAKICFIFAAAVLAAKGMYWALTGQAASSYRIVGSFVWVGTAAALAVIAVDYVNSKHGQEVNVGTSSQSPTEPTTERHRLVKLLIKNHPRISPPIQRHASVFLPVWLGVINIVREERTQQSLQSVVEVFGRALVSVSKEGLIAEATFTLLCLEKEGFIRVKNDTANGMWWGVSFKNIEYEFVHEKLQDFIHGL